MIVLYENSDFKLKAETESLSEQTLNEKSKMHFKITNP